MLNNYNHPEDIRKIIEEQDLVVALFSDLECNVCLSITPDLIEMSEAYPNVNFISADVAAVKALVGEYLVLVYPTIIVFAQGKETKRFERLFSLDVLEETVARFDRILNS